MRRGVFAGQKIVRRRGVAMLFAEFNELIAFRFADVSDDLVTDHGLCDVRIEIQNVADPDPGTGRCKHDAVRLRLLRVQGRRLERQVVYHIRVDAVFLREVVFPILEIRLDVMDFETVGKRAGKSNVNAVVVLAVSERNDKRAFRKLILADTPVKNQLICRYLHTLGAGGDFVQQKDRVLAVALLVGKDLRGKPYGFCAALIRIDQSADFHLRHLRKANVNDFVSELFADLTNDLRFADTRCTQPQNGVLDVVSNVVFHTFSEFPDRHAFLSFITALCICRFS